jgi:hypothetical protein
LLGFLPGIIISQSISFLLEAMSLEILYLILLIGLPVLLIALSMRIQKLKDFWVNLFAKCQKIIADYKILFLIFLVFIQIYSLSWMVQAILVENLLFSQNTSSIQQKFTLLDTNANIDFLNQLLVSKDNKDREVLSRYFTILFLFTLLIGLVIRYLTLSGKENQSAMTFLLKICLGINFLLFATHVILLPGNYGVLLLSNKYQEVKIQFKSNDQEVSVHEDKVSLKVMNRPPKPVNKIRDQRLEVEGIPFKCNLEASPEIFTDPDGDILTYSATSDKPDIAGIEIDKNFLTVSPLQKGKATVTVVAFDPEGLQESTSFNINVEDEILQWGSEVANPISQKNLVVGEIPFILDLMVEPSVFRLLDKDPVQLSFQASSSATEVARVNIKGRKLTVQPISRGSAVITIAANDGYGRLVTSEFNVIVMEQKLKWPVDNGLLLLYQSNDVFFLYSKLEKRIWYVRSEDIESMVYYGLAEVF